MQPIERKNQCSIEEFQNCYLSSNQPVIITDAMDNWRIRSWTPNFLMSHYQNEEVQIYDDLFNLQTLSTLGDYIETYFLKTDIVDQIVPYVRWYTQLNNHEFAWADEFFNKIKEHWKLPYFLPKNNYLLPFSFNSTEVDPTTDKFPAKGLFISAKGAKTRLHYDPWCSDAVLCQIYGEKEIIIYDPSQKKSLYNGRESVNLDKPDLNKFPNFYLAKPVFKDILKPGEIIFFPHNWLHHVTTIKDSISLTWNFVHQSTWPDFFDYLTNNPPQEERNVIDFFLMKHK